MIVKDKPLSLFGTRIGGSNPTPEAFNEMNLFPVPGTNYFEVVGGLYGESVQVMRITGSEYSNMVIQPKVGCTFLRGVVLWLTTNSRLAFLHTAMSREKITCFMLSLNLLIISRSIYLGQSIAFICVLNVDMNCTDYCSNI